MKKYSENKRHRAKKTLARNIRRYRLKIPGLTQEKAAEKADLATNTWERYERPSHYELPSLLTLLEIAETLNVKPGKLLED